MGMIDIYGNHIEREYIIGISPLMRGDSQGVPVTVEFYFDLFTVHYPIRVSSTKLSAPPFGPENWGQKLQDFKLGYEALAALLGIDLPTKPEKHDPA